MHAENEQLRKFEKNISEAAAAFLKKKSCNGVMERDSGMNQKKKRNSGNSDVEIFIKPKK